MSYRYIGNKTRLAPRILSVIRSLVPRGATVADLMCGTASVAEALRSENYRVIAADIMTYALHHARVRLLLDKAPSFYRLGLGPYPEVLNHLQSLPRRKGLFVREYSPAGKPAAGCAPRMYFTAENAKAIDTISTQISNWFTHGLLSDLENSLLRHDLILATNRVANIAGTYGHFRSKWSNGSLGTLSLTPTNFLWGFSTDHLVCQGRAEEVAKDLEANLCYIDPPYMKRQYAANYHIIETIARGDEPSAVGVSGLRPWRDQYSNFCTKTKIFASFEAILSGMRCGLFVISYSEDGLLSREAMTALLKKHGDVEAHTIESNRFRSNNSPLARTLNEYVFILKKSNRARRLSSARGESTRHVSDAT